MAHFEELTQDGTTVFTFHGKIDSSNSEGIGAAVLPQVQGKPSVVFDFGDVQYISSAGLRFVLKAAKVTSSFRVINVHPDVYEVFEMTGFTQIIKVVKALREISIEGKEKIGEGYMGKVYRLDPDTIIKVFYRGGADTLADIERETALAKKAFVLGIPTAIPFDVVKVKEGGYGSVFELLKSNAMNSLFIHHPENADQYIKMYVDLLKTILATEVEPGALPRKKLEALKWAASLRKNKAFEEPILDRIDALIDTIPEPLRVVHGDFHIKNIMMQGDEPLLIDMDTLGYGHPIFEFAGIFLCYIGYGSTEPGNCLNFLGIPDELAAKIYYAAIDGVYADRSEEERKTIADKTALLSYIWFTDKTMLFEPENTKRLEHAKAEVLRLIEKYFTLDF